jgi:hypothetical protein
MAAITLVPCAPIKKTMQSLPLRIKLRPPQFEGPNITHYLYQFENYARLMRWDDEDKRCNFISCIDPTLTSPVFAIQETTTTWPDMRDELVNTFGKDDVPVTCEDLERILLRDNICYDTYMVRFEEAASRAPLISSFLKARILLRQFSVEDQLAITRQCLPKITWEKVKTAAEFYFRTPNQMQFITPGTTVSPVPRIGPASLISMPLSQQAHCQSTIATRSLFQPAVPSLALPPPVPASEAAVAVIDATL